jgi:hypothetical protein
MVAFPAEKIPNETKKSIFSPGIGCSTGWELIVPLKKIKIKKRRFKLNWKTLFICKLKSQKY